MAGDGDALRDMVMEDCADKMRKAVAHLQSEFAAVRTGRASSGLVGVLLPPVSLTMEYGMWT